MAPLSASTSEAGYGGQTKPLCPFHLRFSNEDDDEFGPEMADGDDPTAYVTNLSYYHLVPFETDILD